MAINERRRSCRKILVTTFFIVPCFLLNGTALRLLFRCTVQNDFNLKRSVDGPFQSLHPSDERTRSYKRSENQIVQATGNTTPKCFLQNSQQWLTSPRLGNINISEIDKTLPERLLLSLQAPSFGEFLPILKTTICPVSSAFIGTENINTEHINVSSEIIRIWTVRLFFLAIHRHQHAPAVGESRLRNGYLCTKKKQQYRIGDFDYECPSAKFPVVGLSKPGIGAHMRLGLVSALKAGIATGRVVLLVNNAPSSAPSFLQNPWPLASCNRKDAQCFFQPFSPCVLTAEALADAYTLTRGEMRHVFRSGKVPETHEADRVIVMQLKYRPQRDPENLLPTLRKLVVALLEKFQLSSSQRSVLEDAISETLKVGGILSNQTTHQYGFQSQVHNAMLLYALRPSPGSSASIDNILEEILPSNFEPDHSIGLPIRASDKCGTESECLSFDQYTRSLAMIWTLSSDAEKWKDAKLPVHIVLTTESKNVSAAQQSYLRNPTSEREIAFPFKFVTNHRDVLQNTGAISDVAMKSGPTADEAMLSAMSSLKAQLMTRHTLGNCCSNFHLLLLDLMSEGCGASSFSTFQCLQDHPEEEFRICCAWDNSPRCISRRNATAVNTSRAP
jgi:hypothetical protein